MNPDLRDHACVAIAVMTMARKHFQRATLSEGSRHGTVVYAFGPAVHNARVHYRIRHWWRCGRCLPRLLVASPSQNIADL